MIKLDTEIKSTSSCLRNIIVITHSERSRVDHFTINFWCRWRCCDKLIDVGRLCAAWCYKWLA